MRGSDGLGGLVLMLAAMIAITAAALPVFAGQRLFWLSVTALPLAACGAGLISYGRYWHVPALSKRKFPRIPCQIPAEIIVSPQLPRIQCTVIDISEGGAALSLRPNNTSGIPQNFELLIEGDPRRHVCLVTWMKPDTLGVEFQTASAAVLRIQEAG